MNPAEEQAAAALVGEGYEILSSGWPDFLAVRDGEAVFVEVKQGNDEVRPNQERMHAALLALGLRVRVVRVAREQPETPTPEARPFCPAGCERPRGWGAWAVCLEHFNAM